MASVLLIFPLSVLSLQGEEILFTRVLAPLTLTETKKDG